MKIPKAKQLPSGSWFCRVRVNGQDIGITRPTEKEAVAEAMAVKAGAKVAAKPGRKTLTDAIDDYIAARVNILSPATILGYRRIQKNRFQDVMRLDMHKMTQEKWQRVVNAEARKYSGKTLKNSWLFLASVIREETGERVAVKLPQVIPNERGFLRAEEIPPSPPDKAVQILRSGRLSSAYFRISRELRTYCHIIFAIILQRWQLKRQRCNPKWQ